MSRIASITHRVAGEKGWDEVIAVVIAELNRAEPTEILIEGDLGAGKTFLVRELLSRLGSTDPVRSPSYVLEHRYEAPLSSRPISHWDIYRLRGEIPEELHDFSPDANRIIEWGTLSPELSARASMVISVEIISDTDREVKVTKK